MLKWRKPGLYKAKAKWILTSHGCFCTKRFAGIEHSLNCCELVVANMWSQNSFSTHIHRKYSLWTGLHSVWFCWSDEGSSVNNSREMGSNLLELLPLPPWSWVPPLTYYNTIVLLHSILLLFLVHIALLRDIIEGLHSIMLKDSIARIIGCLTISMAISEESCLDSLGVNQATLLDYLVKKMIDFQVSCSFIFLNLIILSKNET